MSNKSHIIGIDLGTTCCCVGYLHSNQIVEIIENREGHKTTPSYVAFTKSGQVIGNVAKKKVLRTSENVVYDAKRLIGQKYDTKYLESVKQYNWPFEVTSDADDTFLINTTSNGKFKPQQISAILLKYMKTIAEERLDTEVKNAVITVPAHFNYHQRTATKEAGKLAGLNVLKIINEPTAAALAYVHKNEISGEVKNILVFDLGGGTFDVSLLTVEEQFVTVKGTDGNTALGGRDFDNNLVEFILDKIEKRYIKEIKTNDTARRRITAISESLKIELSSDTTTTLELHSLVGDRDVCFEITRTDFDQINTQLYQICIDVVENCLKDAKINKTEIDKIVLVGGSTRIPKIQEMLKDFFGGKQLTKAINPDEAVAYGAAVQAAMLNEDDNTEAPYEINDVTPLSLGISVAGDLMSVIIPRNSKIPISKTKQFVTNWNNRTCVQNLIYEGERSIVAYNTLIGRIEIKHPPKPAGYPYKITFHVNSNGILEVSAQTEDGGSTNLVIKYEKPNINTTHNMLKDAEINKAKDNNIRKVTEKWKKLKHYCTKMEALCEYAKTGITEAEKFDIRIICKNVTIWLDNNKVREGSPREQVAILDKIKEIENICEPIANCYGYYVKNVTLQEFHQLLTK